MTDYETQISVSNINCWCWQRPIITSEEWWEVALLLTVMLCLAALEDELTLAVNKYNALLTSNYNCNYSAMCSQPCMQCNSCFTSKTYGKLTITM